VVHVPDEPHSALLQHLVQSVDDALDPGVVGSDPVAHQPVRRGQTFQQVDLHVQVGLGQDVGRVDPGWAGTHDGDTERSRGRHGVGCLFRRVSGGAVRRPRAMPSLRVPLPWAYPGAIRLSPRAPSCAAGAGTRVDSRLVTLPAPPPAADGELDRRGLAAGFGGYLWWGMLPLYFPLLAPAGPWEITAHRGVWSLLLCLLVLAMLGQLGTFWRLLRTTRVSARLGLAAVLLCANWVTFVLAVLTGHVVEASLGYYINPLVTAGMAVTILGERLRTAQWVAAGLGASGVVVIAIGNGTFPWISLVLAGSFGGYGLVKKQVGEKVPALPGLGVETLTLAPAAVVQIGRASCRERGWGSGGAGARRDRGRGSGS